MQISFFSVDLKLSPPKTADDPGFRVLEFNDGLRSGFTGYDALGGERMVTQKVVNDYANLFPGMPVIGPANHNAALGKAIILPRTDEMIKATTRIDMMTAQSLSDRQITVNSNLHFHALTENKGYQYFMAEQMGEKGASLFPPSAILMNRHVKGEADQLPQNDSGYVLKPLALAGGTGVRLVAHDEREPTLKHLLRQPYIFHRDVWMGHSEAACLLQHKVDANEVETEQGVYDGTMRVAFTIYGEADNLECYIHDAYWKLPKKTINDDAGLESVVSFSPSNFDRKNQPLYKVFLSAASAIYGIPPAQDELKKIRSAPVEQSTKDQLFPALQTHLREYFQHTARADLLENAQILLSGPQPGRIGLGVMMALHRHFYPPVSPEKINAIYPSSIFQSLEKTIVPSGAVGHIFRGLNNIQMKGLHPDCDQPEDAFLKPLRQALDDAAHEDIFGDLSDNLHGTLNKIISMMPRLG